MSAATSQRPGWPEMIRSNCESASSVQALNPNPGARLRACCFPYAGGGAAAFNAWAKELPPDILQAVELCAIQLPGREANIAHPPFERLLQPESLHHLPDGRRLAARHDETVDRLQSFNGLHRLCGDLRVPQGRKMLFDVALQREHADGDRLRHGVLSSAFQPRSASS